MEQYYQGGAPCQEFEHRIRKKDSGDTQKPCLDSRSPSRRQGFCVTPWRAQSGYWGSRPVQPPTDMTRWLQGRMKFMGRGSPVGVTPGTSGHRGPLNTTSGESPPQVERPPEASVSGGLLPSRHVAAFPVLAGALWAAGEHAVQTGSGASGASTTGAGGSYCPGPCCRSPRSDPRSPWAGTSCAGRRTAAPTWSARAGHPCSGAACPPGC